MRILIVLFLSSGFVFAGAEAVLRDYCIRCHGQKKQKASLNIEAMLGEKPLVRNRQAWLDCLDQVKEGKMPPEDAKEMPEAKRRLLQDWLHKEVRDFDYSSIRNAGYVGARRLTHLILGQPTPIDNGLANL